MKYACIRRHQGEFKNVRLLCRVLGVSPSGFYKACLHASGRRPVSARTQANQRLLVGLQPRPGAEQGRERAAAIDVGDQQHLGPRM